MNKTGIILLSCITAIAIFSGCNNNTVNKTEIAADSKEMAVANQSIEAFKPFNWSDSVYDIVKKIQEMPEAEGATISTMMSQDVPIKNLSKDDITKIVNKALPESGYESMETYGNFEYLDKDGKKLISNECGVYIRIPSIYLNNIKYKMQINMKAIAGADVLYPNNTLSIRKFHVPLVIEGIKFFGENIEEIASKDDGKITKTLVDKYNSIDPVITKREDGKIVSTKLIDNHGASIVIQHTLFENPQKMAAAFIDYYAPVSEYDKAYTDREIKFQKNAGISTDMSKSL